MQLCIGWGCLRGWGCVTGAGDLEHASLHVLAHEMSRGFLQGPRAWGCPIRHPSLGRCTGSEAWWLLCWAALLQEMLGCSVVPQPDQGPQQETWVLLHFLWSIMEMWGVRG